MSWNTAFDKQVIYTFCFRIGFCSSSESRPDVLSIGLSAAAMWIFLKIDVDTSIIEIFCYDCIHSSIGAFGCVGEAGFDAKGDFGTR